MHRILVKNDGIAFLIRIVVFVPVVRLPFDACQQMIEEARSKVLFEDSSTWYSGRN
jgi:hypothetical protein